MKSTTLAPGSKANTGHAPAPPTTGRTTTKIGKQKSAPNSETVLIGGHFSPEVRRTLLLVQADPQNDGKNLRDLLGEAINDLCAKYGKPQPFHID